MFRLALTRLAGAIPTLLLLIALAFVMMRAAPGGPFDKERALPPEVLAQMQQAYHLDEPLWQQFGRYLGGVLRGDLGPSYQYSDFSVNQLIGKGVPVSLQLGASAMLLGLLLGGTAGVIAALRQNHFTDHAVMTLAMTGLSLPVFVIAPLMILAFAVHLGWFPAGGWSGSWTEGGWRDKLLPITALALPQIAVIARLMRGSMVEVLRSNYILTARAKGLPMRTVVLRHALRPALMPVISYLGPAAAGIITGSVVIEQIFSIPGIGRYFVQAALNRDYTLVMGVVLFYGALIILFNFIVDLLYGVLDPRLRA